MKIVLLSLIALALASCEEGAKRTFLFPKIDINAGENGEEIVAELRNLPLEPSQGDLRLFVDELILGPQTPRLRPLFSLGTSIKFCFTSEKEGKNVLFVGLSEDAISQNGSCAEIQLGIQLFERNIRENFKNIEEIVLFIGDSVVNEYQN